LRVAIIPIIPTLRVAKLVIWITILIIVLIVRHPYLLNIAVTIWFDNLYSGNIARIETKDHERITAYPRRGWMRTWSTITSARDNSHIVVSYLKLNSPLIVRVPTEINLHITRIPSPITHHAAREKSLINVC